MRIMVVGGSGLLGSKIVTQTKDKHTVLATYNSRNISFENTKTLRLDKTDRENVFKTIEEFSPDWVIDTAAYHSVDGCETDRELCRLVNVEGTKNIVDACREYGCRLVFVSTDYVFDGVKGFYTEEDEPNPLNYYGLCKLEAEKIVAKLDEYIIVRPSVVYGWEPYTFKLGKSSSGKGMNFAMWLISMLKENKSVKIVTDQYSTPTFADNMAEAILRLVELGKHGLYHISGSSCINRYDFSLIIANVFGFDTRLIKPVTSDVFVQKARRPMRSCLCTEKVQGETGVRMFTAIEGVLEMKRQMGV